MQKAENYLNQNDSQHRKDNVMKKRKPLPGYVEAMTELEVAVIYCGRETKVIMEALRSLKRQLPNCNYSGGASNLDNYLMGCLRKDMALSLQRIMRHVNMTRKAVLTFLEANRLE